MNTGNMQGTMGSRGGPVGPQQGHNGGPRRQTMGMEPWQREVIVRLQQDQFDPGWQSTLGWQIRATNIYHL